MNLHKVKKKIRLSFPFSKLNLQLEFPLVSKLKFLKLAIFGQRTCLRTVNKGGEIARLKMPLSNHELAKSY